MATFKDKNKTEFTEKSYLKRLFVYLESEEDHQIIGERWFFDEDFEFRSSGHDANGAGGCSMVIKKVRDDEDNGIESVGLVDRDILLKDQNWDLWWETDDINFKAAQPYGEKIKVLTRWEIENYLLLEPEIIAEMKADCSRGKKSIQRPAPIPLSFDEIVLLTTLTCADTVCHQNGNKKVGDNMVNFNKTNHELRNSLEAKNISLHALDAMKQKADQFAEGEAEGSKEHWLKQSRILNGKAILKRLELFGGRDDHRFTLASKIFDKNKIDEEIKNYIQEFREISV